MKLEHPSIQFNRFIEGARNVGFTEIEVLNVTDKDGQKVEIDAALKAQIEGCVKAPEKQLTPEQQELKSLREMVAALQAGKPAGTVVGSGEDIEVLRGEYFELFKKKPHHKTTAETLRAEIDAELAK